MPRASRIPVNENLRLELQDNFAFLISSLSSSRDIQQFFETFLTNEEKTMLTKRLMLHLLLENKYSPPEISLLIGLTRGTVHIHRRLWLTGGARYRTIIAEIAKRKKTKLFWKKVESTLRPVGYFLRAKSNMKARSKLLSGDYD